MRRTLHLRFVTLVASVFLAGCGGGPPSDQVTAKITQAVFAANTAMFEGGKEDAEVVSIDVGAWKTETMPQGPTMYEAMWTAKLRFTQPLACVLAEVDGKNLVQIVAQKGEELPFEGRCGGVHQEGKWEVSANAQAKTGNDLMGAGAWQPIADKVPDLKMGYQVYRDGARSNPKFRVHNFEPLAKLQPYVIEGSAEHKALDAAAQKRFETLQAAAAQQARQRQEALAAQQKKAQDDAAERQRLQQEQQAAAAEVARVAKEAATKKAEDDRRARLLAVMKPFQSTTGAVMTAEAGPTLGTLLLDAAIDDAKLTVAGRAVDLREMPFAEFTFAGSVDDRGTFTYTSSLGGNALTFGAAADKLQSRAGFTIAALSAGDRAKLDALVALGKRLGAAAPTQLGIETLDAAAAKTREPQLKLTGLSGAVFYRARLAPAVANLFAADLGANKAYAWKSKEVVAIRLTEPAKGAGLYIRGAAAPSTELVVTVNGVHEATIAAIPKLGGVVLSLPPDLEVLDIRFAATGAVAARTIGLVK